MGQGSSEWVISDLRGVSWGGWGWKIHFQGCFVIYIYGPLVFPGFSLSMWHLTLQDLSEWCRLLLAWWSQVRWVSDIVINFPQTIQFKPPQQKLQGFFWLDLRNPITSHPSHVTVKQVANTSPDTREEELPVSGRSCQEFAAGLNRWHGLTYREYIFLVQWLHR